MKKLLLLTITVLAALTVTGCVNFQSHTDIQSDGSGVAQMSMSMSPSIQEALAEMKAMDSSQADEMDFPLLDDLQKDKIEKAAKGRGVKIKKFEKAMVDGRETVEIVMAFDDLEGLSYVMNRVMGDGASNDGMGIFDAGDGNYVLKQTTYDFPVEDVVEEEVEEESDPMEDMQNMDPEQMQKQMEIMGKLMGAMAELDVSFQITVPGDIISSNAPTTDGRTSVWSINSSNMMTMDQDMEPEIVFSGKGLKLKPMTE